MTTLEQTIPVVDAQALRSDSEQARLEFIDTVGGGLRDIGFFAVENHGVDAALIREAYVLAKELFLLPPDVKLQYEKGNLRGGYTRYGKEVAIGGKAPDLKEFWHVGREPGSTDGELSDVWPSELPSFKHAMSELYRQLEALNEDLLKACALFIGEPEDRFSSMVKNGPSVLRVIHYPPVPKEANPLSVRAAAHGDINFITLLCEATDGGLELLDREDNWCPIHALDGQIVVDAGDMLQHLTNGYYKSTIHRVVNPDNCRDARYSMPFFVHPRSNERLNPLPGCIARTGGKAKYPPLTAGEFLKERLRKIGL